MVNRGFKISVLILQVFCTLFFCFVIGVAFANNREFERNLIGYTIQILCFIIVNFVATMFLFFYRRNNNPIDNMLLQFIILSFTLQTTNFMPLLLINMNDYFYMIPVIAKVYSFALISNIFLFLFLGTKAKKCNNNQMRDGIIVIVFISLLFTILTPLALNVFTFTNDHLFTRFTLICYFTLIAAAVVCFIINIVQSREKSRILDNVAYMLLVVGNFASLFHNNIAVYITAMSLYFIGIVLLVLSRRVFVRF